MEPNKVHLLNNHPTFASVAALIFFSQLTQRHRCRKEDEKDVCSFFTLSWAGTRRFENDQGQEPGDEVTK